MTSCTRPVAPSTAINSRPRARRTARSAGTANGNFVPSINRAELTGTGDGRLFAFYTKLGTPNGSYIGQINTTTAAVTAEQAFPTLDQGNGWAFAFWGGDFYFYTANSMSSSKTTTVARYRPSDKSLDTAYMTNIGFHIVGAGVSTCAPTTLPN